MPPHYWNDAVTHLSAACPTMAQLIANYPAHESMTGRGDAFYTLMRSIVGQQISVKAADSVWNKLEGKIKTITPQKILRAKEETLRACGLSGQKVSYAKNLAQYFIEKRICSPLEGERDLASDNAASSVGGLSITTSPHRLASARRLPLKGGVKESFFTSLTDAEIIAELTSIKGISVWTAQMFLMFHLLRPNVFPVQDIGLIKGLERHYNKGQKLTKSEIIAHGERFSPYRSVATWYLWRSLDPVPVAY